MDIDPAGRLSIDDCLKHPWMAPFTRDYDHANADMCKPLHISIDDDTKHDVTKYRSTLYEELRATQKDNRMRSKFFQPFRSSRS